MRFTPISKEFSFADFDCGNEALNNFLKDQALLNHERRLGATTLFVNDGGDCLVYYTICPWYIDWSFLPKNFGGHLPSQVPAIKLARLAIAKKVHQNGYGGILL